MFTEKGLPAQEARSTGWRLGVWSIDPSPFWFSSFHFSPKTFNIISCYGSLRGLVSTWNLEVSAISLSHWEVSFISVLHPLSWDALFGAFYRTDAWYLTRTGKTYREQSIAVGAEQEIQSDHYISVLFFTFTVLFFLNYKTVKHYYHY